MSSNALPEQAHAALEAAAAAIRALPATAVSPQVWQRLHQQATSAVAAADVLVRRMQSAGINNSKEQSQLARVRQQLKSAETKNARANAATVAVAVAAPARASAPTVAAPTAPVPVVIAKKSHAEQEKQLTDEALAALATAEKRLRELQASVFPPSEWARRQQPVLGALSAADKLMRQMQSERMPSFKQVQSQLNRLQVELGRAETRNKDGNATATSSSTPATIAPASNSSASAAAAAAAHEPSQAEVEQRLNDEALAALDLVEAKLQSLSAQAAPPQEWDLLHHHVSNAIAVADAKLQQMHAAGFDTARFQTQLNTLRGQLRRAEQRNHEAQDAGTAAQTSRRNNEHDDSGAAELLRAKANVAQLEAELTAMRMERDAAKLLLKQRDDELAASRVRHRDEIAALLRRQKGEGHCAEEPLRGENVDTRHIQEQLQTQVQQLTAAQSTRTTLVAELTTQLAVAAQAAADEGAARRSMAERLAVLEVELGQKQRD